jgi:integrase
MAFLADAAVPGLGVIWGSKGRPSWTFAYRVHQPDGENKQFRMKLGFASPDTTAQPGWLTVDQARSKAYNIREAARVGLHVQTPKPPPVSPVAVLSLGQAVDDYLADPNVRKLRSAGELGRLLHKELGADPFLPKKEGEDLKPNPLHALWCKPLTNITKADIRALLDAKGATHIANRLHGALGTFYRWAIDRDLTPISPVPSARPLTVEESRKRVLSDCELAKVWHATTDRPLPKQAIVRLLILTGQRREEVAEMRWSELDLSASTWTISAARYKTKTDHVIPLVPAALALIEAQQRISGSDYVFTYDGKRAADMSQEGSELKSLTPDVPDWRLHDLRRTFRTGLAKLKVTREIADLIDHPRSGVTGTYDRHLYLEEKTAALTKWADYVAGLISPKVC